MKVIIPIYICRIKGIYLYVYLRGRGVYPKISSWIFGTCGHDPYVGMNAIEWYFIGLFEYLLKSHRYSAHHLQFEASQLV